MNIFCTDINKYKRDIDNHREGMTAKNTTKSRHGRSGSVQHQNEIFLARVGSGEKVKHKGRGDAISTLSSWDDTTSLSTETTIKMVDSCLAEAKQKELKTKGEITNTPSQQTPYSKCKTRLMLNRASWASSQSNLEWQPTQSDQKT